MSKFDPRRRMLRMHAETKNRLIESGVIIPSPSSGRLAVSRYHQYSHPVFYDKETAMQDAVNMAAFFCVQNDVLIPAFVNTSLGGRCYGTCSKWSNGTYLVSVDLSVCKLPSTSEYSWSWPGYKADATVAGVIAHEIGHLGHWHDGSSENRRLFAAWAKYTADEPPVSSYEPNVSESFSEAMKLFILNPTLLEECWPRRYEILCERFKPVVPTHWSEILAESPRHLNAVKNRLRKTRH